MGSAFQFGNMGYNLGSNALDNMRYTAFFFSNGNIAVTDSKKGGEQVPELQQKAIPVLFAEFLESKGYDPTNFLLKLSSGEATLFKTEFGWNWRIT